MRYYLVALIAIFSLGVAACTPRPADIPKDAERHSSLKGGKSWSWTRNIDGGCVAWMAKKEWAKVQIRPGTPCPQNFREGKIDGHGITYFSSSDIIDIDGYWPWSSKISRDLIVFDKDGMIEDVLPCPYTMTKDQISANQSALVNAVKTAQTDGEKRVLNRMIDRLACMDGTALESGQHGCQDNLENSKYDYWEDK